MRTFLLLLLLILPIALLYATVLGQAKKDMARRSQAGLDNTPVYAILLIPVIGPVIYLLVRPWLTRL